MQSFTIFLRRIALGAVFLAVSFSLSAQDTPDPDWNHFGLNLRVGLNIGAKFGEPAHLAFPAAPRAGSDVNRQYNDGFVDADSSGNAGGQTWNWAYQHDSQVSGSDLLMHATGLEGGSEHATDDPNLGFDFNYVRDFGHYRWGQWGIKFAFGYTHVQVNDNDPMGLDLATITDRYPLNGVVPPVAPYTGSVSGPGPVIGSQPIGRSLAISPNGGIVSGNHNIDAALYDLRLGPSFNIPLSRRFSLQTGGGLALGVVDSEFTFHETISPVSGTASTAAGRNDSAGFVAGAYAELGFAYKVCRSGSIFTGAQFEYLGDFDQSANGRSARLDFGQTVFYELGFQWQF